MKPENIPLLIPVENQVRELDPKLLLACIAAGRGFSSIIGSRRELHFHINSFPRGIYVSKSITSASELMFKILHKLGHQIVAWDEEALVHLPAETYYSRRLSPVAMSYVSQFFAWGEDNAELWLQYPYIPDKRLVQVTGNPRNDLLRREMRSFYNDDVKQIRNKYSNFILINTNFNHVNAFSPVQNLFQPSSKIGEKPKFGRAARGMTREYAEGFHKHKRTVFQSFLELIPRLEKDFSDVAIVLRPHPTESQDVYHQIASECKRVRVTNKGNVVPWLSAARLVIHNGCTTGVEAYAMGVPAISYRAVVDDDYDMGFYQLPNLLSHQCFDYDSLRSSIKRILEGELGAADGEERHKLVDRHLAALDGSLACERIVEALCELASGRSHLPQPGIIARVTGRTLARGRTIVKRCKDARPGGHNRPEFQKHRFPPLTLENVTERIIKFQRIIGDTKQLRIEKMLKQFFLISPV